MIDQCPHCGVSLIGAEIPEAIREQYGMATHFRREVGIYDQRRDRTVAWCCPDCQRTWPREEPRVQQYCPSCGALAAVLEGSVCVACTSSGRTWPREDA